MIIFLVFFSHLKLKYISQMALEAQKWRIDCFDEKTFEEKIRFETLKTGPNERPWFERSTIWLKLIYYLDMLVLWQEVDQTFESKTGWELHFPEYI